MRRKIRAVALLTAFLLLISAFPASADIVYRHACAGGKKKIALTFDDGPHPRYTPEILDILAEYGVPATFFTVGENAEYYKDLVRREIAEGHEVGNHSYHHYRTGKTDPEVVRKDIIACEKALRSITGKTPHYLRPPEGVCTEGVKALAEARGYTIVLWSVDTRDWAHTPPEEICRNVMANARNGSIILMHDFIGKNSPTPAALRLVLPMLQESGFEFVTVSQLLAG